MNRLRWPVQVVGRVWRRRRLSQLLDDLVEWEVDGRDLLARVCELTDEGDDLHQECRRVLDLLTGP
jgi:hypothetical protein